MTPAPNGSLGDRVRDGVRWSAGAQYAGMVVRLAVAVALARLLGPADFGVMALAMAIVGVAALVQESGLGAALVRHRGPLEPAAGAMLLLTGAGGVLLAIGVWLAAPLAAGLLEQPPLVPVLRAMAVACLLRAAAQTPRALLQRALRFRALALLELGATAVYGAVGLGFALAGAGVWSLVAAQLANELTVACGAWALRPVALPRAIEPGVMRALAAFGRPVMAANLLSLVHTQLPTLVAGRLLGAAGTGFWAVGARWASLPVIGITHVAGRVAYPALARLDDPRRLAAGWLRVLGTVLALAVPVAIGLALLGDALVRTLYDARWEPAIGVLRWLAFFGLFHATAATTGELFKAAGRPRWVAGWALVYDALLVAGLVWLAPRHGLTGIAIAVTAAPALVMVGSIASAARLLAVPARGLAGAVVPPVLAALVLAAVVVAVRGLVRLAGGGSPLELVAGGAAGALAYAATLRVLAPAAVAELRGLLGLPPRRPPAAPPSRAAALVRRAPALVAGLVALGLAGEAGLRLAGRGASPDALGPWSERRAWEALRRLDAAAGPTPIPGGHARWRLQPWNAVVDYRLDVDGMRVAAAARAPQAGCRVAVLGDSNAFGYGVPADATIAARLAAPAVEPPMTVRNAGLCGANVVQLASWARAVTARAEPDVVVLVLSPWSLRVDAPPAEDLEGLDRAVAQRWKRLARWSALAERTGWWTTHWLGRAVGWPAHSVVAWELQPLVDDDAAFARRWTAVRAALGALTAAARRGGARVLLVYVPLDVQVSRARNALYRGGRLPYATHGFVERDYTRDHRHADALRTWAAAHDVPWLDATPLLRRDGARAFLEDDYHLSAAGLRTIAAALQTPVAAACNGAAAPPPRIVDAAARSAPLAAAVPASPVGRTTATETEEEP